MEITNKVILVLGGTGLVGTEVVKKIAEDAPKKIVLLSLGTDRDLNNLKKIKDHFPKQNIKYIKGNIFNNEDLNLKLRKSTDKVFEQTLLYKAIISNQPEIIVDCINTAGSLVYTQKNGQSLLPKLIRHVNILYQATRKNNIKKRFKQGARIYIKVGTTGTGGMGFDIPYTHGETHPSESLLTKASLAWAHTGLLFLMSRTSDAPIVKEIKPATAIAWGEIDYGVIKPNSVTIPLIDTTKAIKLGKLLNLTGHQAKSLSSQLKSVYISTGENGYFSLQEFIALTSPGQMEFVTAEEVAKRVIQEIKGVNTGKNILSALDASVVDASYRAGVLREHLILKMKKLSEEKKTEGIAFEILGPPRLSKLLIEANLIKQVFGFKEFQNEKNIQEVAEKINHFILSKQKIRSQIISIGIPILLPNGKNLIAGKTIKVPNPLPKPVTKVNINNWANDGWVDLRPQNLQLWQKRLEAIRKFMDIREVEEGEIVAWIFEHEDQGSS